MDFPAIMQTYFRGERLMALYYLIPGGLALVGLGITAVTAWRDGFGWGLATPLALLGLALVGVGISLTLETPGQVDGLLQAYAADPAAMVAVELPRMQAVNRNWPVLFTTWTVLVIVGLGLRFGLKADWAHGLGVALIAAGAAGFLVDSFAERRSGPYTAALEQLAAEHGLPDAAPRP